MSSSVDEIAETRREMEREAKEWQPMASAPRDGTFIRLYFRPGFGREKQNGLVAQWQQHDEMPAGGSWFDKDGAYVTPGPIAWLPETGSIN